MGPGVVVRPTGLGRINSWTSLTLWARTLLVASDRNLIWITKRKCIVMKPIPWKSRGSARLQKQLEPGVEDKATAWAVSCVWKALLYHLVYLLFIIHVSLVTSSGKPPPPTTYLPNLIIQSLSWFMEDFRAKKKKVTCLGRLVCASVLRKRYPFLWAKTADCKWDFSPLAPLAVLLCSMHRLYNCTKLLSQILYCMLSEDCVPFLLLVKIAVLLCLHDFLRNVSPARL